MSISNEKQFEISERGLHIARMATKNTQNMFYPFLNRYGLTIVAAAFLV